MFSLNIIRNIKKNKTLKNKIINVFVIMTFMLLSVVLYFILKGCNNYCIVDDPSSVLKYNISIPFNKFLIPLFSPDKHDLYTILNIFSINYPYIWMIVSIIVSYFVIKNKPKNNN